MRVLPGRGLTLVELVITICLAAIISIPVGILLSEHLTAALRARDYTVAMDLARYEMEQLDSLNDFCHSDLNVNSPSGTTIDPYQGYPYALTRTIWCQAGDCTSNCSASPPIPNANNGVKRLEIRMRKSGSSETLASLITYRTKYVIFGQ